MTPGQCPPRTSTLRRRLPETRRGVAYRRPVGHTTGFLAVFIVQKRTEMRFMSRPKTYASIEDRHRAYNERRRARSRSPKEEKALLTAIGDTKDGRVLVQLIDRLDRLRKRRALREEPVSATPAGEHSHGRQTKAASSPCMRHWDNCADACPERDSRNPFIKQQWYEWPRWKQAAWFWLWTRERMSDPPTADDIAAEAFAEKISEEFTPVQFAIALGIAPEGEQGEQGEQGV